MEEKLLRLIEKAGGVTKFAAYFVTSHEDFIIPIEYFMDNMDKSDQKGELIENIRSEVFDFTCKMFIKYLHKIPPEIIAKTIANELDDLIPTEVIQKIEQRLAD